MRVVLTGASGQLGSYLLESLGATGHEVRAWSGSEAGERRGVRLVPIDLTDEEATERALDAADPAVVVHAAAVSAAEAVRRDPDRGWAVNVRGTEHLTSWCARRGRRLVFTSTDLVFDGSRPWNREDDPAEPVLAYGRTKRAAEQVVLATPGALTARVSLLYGPSRSGRPAFFDATLAALRRGEPQTLFEDEFRTPLDFGSAAEVLARLMVSDATGLIHVAGRERMGRWELVRRAALASGLDPGLVRANRRADVTLPEPRPADVSLDSSRLHAWFPDWKAPTVEEALASG